MHDPTVSDAAAWLLQIAHEAKGNGLTALAVAAGLTLHPMPVPTPARRVRLALIYSVLDPHKWTDAFITREIAQRALECVGRPMRSDLIPLLVPAVRRAACAASAPAAASMTSIARVILPQTPRPERARSLSEQRLRPTSV